MSKPLSMQEVLLKLNEFWASKGCIIWQPHNVQVGAGTMNPATIMRVLGPEPWNVGYVEPSVRPDDGRFGENPNRMQYYYQYQVILKPDPGNPQEIYLESLEALGVDRRRHDIRFVEDNWKHPGIGAWGLGWEVWLDGMEITQFTYFQQAGGQNLNPVSVEITYGIERILMALQGVEAVWDIQWTDDIKYGDLLLQAEVDHCHYYFNLADVDALKDIYTAYERESERALAYEMPLVMPAYDYLIKCSHLFNVMDTRGAIGVVERANYFRRMQRLAMRIAEAYVDQRRSQNFPLLPEDWELDQVNDVVIGQSPQPPAYEISAYPAEPATFLLEIGTEEIPAADLDSALAQMRELVPHLLVEARLEYESLTVTGTPRRLVLVIEGLSPSQKAEEQILRGPPAHVAFDADGNPTKAAEGFARKNSIDISQLERREMDGGEYAAAVVQDAGLSAAEVLSNLLPELIVGLHFEQNMRWNWSGIAFSRPIRWLVALLDDQIVPVAYADVFSGRTTRGTRLLGDPELELKDTAAYFKVMQDQGIIIDHDARQAAIQKQIDALASTVGGVVKTDLDLLAEVTNLVEQPTALLGQFEQEYIDTIPTPVLITVMKKHQRYFAVVDQAGKLLPYFIAVRNGNSEHLDVVTKGNEGVIRARFADAAFFIDEDSKQSLADFLPKLKTLTFQEQLGSYYDKSARLEGLAGRLATYLGYADDVVTASVRAAHLSKADLVTSMVVEITSLQGTIGRDYALRSGESELVAEAIEQHYSPRSAAGTLPQVPAGITVALADRIDSIAGLFAVGLAPTGSADPYGLRRAAQGVVQILMGHELDIDLRQIISWTGQGLPKALRADAEKALPEIMEFINGRLYGVLREEFAHDVVEAVLGESGHNPYRASIHAAQLSEWVARADWETTLDAYARCARITRSQDRIYKLAPQDFGEKVEQTLHEAYATAASALGENPDVNGMLNAFQPLVEPINTFFAPADEGGVLVMHEDQAIRENRLALLQHIVALAEGVADFSRLEGF